MQLAFEIYRALGSLIYQKGAYLNAHNLNRLFGTDDSLLSNKKTRQELNIKDGLLFLIREQVQGDISELIASGVTDNVEAELNNKLNLITTQLTHNLTMKTENCSADHEKAKNQYSKYAVSYSIKPLISYCLICFHSF